MKRTVINMRYGLLVVVAIFAIVALTFSVSLSKLAIRHEYKLQLAMVEHFTFSAGDRKSVV